MLVNHVHVNIKHIFSTITDSCICQKVVSIYLLELMGSLHTTIFSKYTELLQLKNIFRIF